MTNSAASRAFTLTETIIAVLVFGIGLIMLATVFPVAGNWARQSNEETAGQMIGQTAIAAIQARFKASDFSGVGTTVVALPFTTQQLPWRTRGYQYGSLSSGTPWPVPSTINIPPMYSWIALIRRQPGQIPGQDNRFDIYVLVCKKGQTDQTFGNDAAGLQGRLSSDPKNSAGNHYLPRLATTNSFGTLNSVRCVGVSSGRIWRVLPGSQPTEDCWYVPAPDNSDSTASPVLYIYQSTVAF